MKSEERSGKRGESRGRCFALSALLSALSALPLLAGCTVVSANRTFPKLAWYWSAEAQNQRQEKQAAKEYRQNHSATNL